MPLPADAGQAERLWVIMAGSGEEPSTVQNIRTQAGLAGLSGDWVTIVTLHTPASATQVCNENRNGIFILRVTYPEVDNNNAFRDTQRCFVEMLERQ